MRKYLQGSFFFLIRLQARAYIRTVAAECCKTENKWCKQTVNNENLKQIRVTDTKRGKMPSSDLIYDWVWYYFLLVKKVFNQ